MSRRPALPSAALALAVVTALTGCGGSSAPAQSTPKQTSASPSPSPSATRASLPPGQAVPAALRGTWVDRDNDQVTLHLAGRIYQVRAGATGAGGQLSVKGHDLFAFVGHCPSDLGHYRWSVRGRILKLSKLQDGCYVRSSVFAGRVWVRRG